MAEVLRQLSKMSREERLRIAHWILDSIANGEVVRPTRDDQDEFPFLGYWEDDRSTEEIIADIEGSRTMGRIAATALTSGCPLATGNVRHFDRFEGLEIQDWTSQDFKEEKTK